MYKKYTRVAILNIKEYKPGFIIPMLNHIGIRKERLIKEGLH